MGLTSFPTRLYLAQGCLLTSYYIQYDYFIEFTKNGGIVNTSSLEYATIAGNKEAPMFVLEKVKESLKDYLDIYDPHFVKVRTTIEHIKED